MLRTGYAVLFLMFPVEAAHLHSEIRDLMILCIFVLYSPEFSCLVLGLVFIIYRSSYLFSMSFLLSSVFAPIAIFCLFVWQVGGFFLFPFSFFFSLFLMRCRTDGSRRRKQIIMKAHSECHSELHK
ncbi:hypothetical protein BZA05DRAFT_398037 [Tricharina praecox]|uniref:uncharacterized protein n=1 Tax=Tricharina praecox TaxID=43433 RepID=UPI00221EBD2F|nr:uncharacterized protein BZA05DRAFT_398037 [Tricharina praecox]KAI5851855.1 hypothetical protein BZA05DRAFT_398037 [Tricharina praecox]